MNNNTKQYRTWSENVRASMRNGPPILQVRQPQSRPAHFVETVGSSRNLTVSYRVNFFPAKEETSLYPVRTNHPPGHRVVSPAVNSCYRGQNSLKSSKGDSGAIVRTSISGLQFRVLPQSLSP